MREKEFVLNREVCDGVFIDGVDTEAELYLRTDVQACRFYGPEHCPVVNGGPGCIVLDGQRVARGVIQFGTTIEDEVADYASNIPMPDRGFFDPTVEEPDRATKDRVELAQRVTTWVKKHLV